MFRTRDFVLIFTTIVFLVSAIGMTLWQQYLTDSGSDVLVPTLVDSIDQTFTAEVPVASGPTREQRVQAMRDKIAAAPQLSAAPDQALESPIIDLETSQASSTDSLTSVSECDDDIDYIGFWDARTLTVVASEGAVLVSQALVSANGSTTNQTILQLPARAVPSGSVACIDTDVIGVANDGSLIRNDEIALYSVFDSGTQIGFALDGFPIYGTGAATVDSCGGRVVAGQYRYELQPASESIISCFAATPVALP